MPGEGGGGTDGTTRGYRYGFNGKENDNEVKGEGNQQDYGMRVYDPRIGKFLSVDPLTANYPDLGAYAYAADNPIRLIDVLGMGPGDPPDQSWPPRQSMGGKVAEFIYTVFYDFPFYTDKGKRHSKELLNATMPSVLGTINGTASNVTFSTRSAESIGLNEEHAKVFNNTTKISAYASALMIGGGGSGAAPAPRLAIVGASELVTVQTIKPLIQIASIVFAKAKKDGGENRELNWSWKSEKTFGHILSRHGQKESVESLADRARSRNDGTGTGQWLDNVKAAEFIKSIYSTLKDGVNYVNIPAGLGRVVNADKTTTATTRAMIIKNEEGATNALKTGYPIQ